VLVASNTRVFHAVDINTRGCVVRYHTITSKLLHSHSIMASYEVSKENNFSVEANSDHGIGIIESLEDQTNREFYGASISDSYRMKSEIVSKCMNDIGMGRYQWCLFVVTGFGWITDNLYAMSFPFFNMR
jgi:hypothetical protein